MEVLNKRESKTLEEGAATKQKREKEKEKEQKETNPDNPAFSTEECYNYLQFYNLGKVIGEGSFGKVIEACGQENVDRKDCNWVVKVGKMNRTRKGGLDRDIFFLKHLKEVEVDDEPLVPNFLTAWSCAGYPIFDPQANRWLIRPDPNTQYDFVLMDKWDGDMHTLINRHKYITLHQLWSMFRKAALLGEWQIVQGDLKPDNFLWRPADSSHQLVWQDQIEIVITDFGFSGFVGNPPAPENFRAKIGWTSALKELKCQDSKSPIALCPDALEIPSCSESQSQRYASAVNVTQLEAYFVTRREPIPVWDDIPLHPEETEEDQKQEANRFLGYFGGITELKRYPQTFCQNYTDEEVRRYGERLLSTKKEPLLMLSFLDLTAENVPDQLPFVVLEPKVEK